MMRQHLLRSTRRVRATNSWESDGSSLVFEYHLIVFHDEEGANARHPGFLSHVRLPLPRRPLLWLLRRLKLRLKLSLRRRLTLRLRLRQRLLRRRLRPRLRLRQRLLRRRLRPRLLLLRQLGLRMQPGSGCVGRCLPSRRRCGLRPAAATAVDAVAGAEAEAGADAAADDAAAAAAAAATATTACIDSTTLSTPSAAAAAVDTNATIAAA
jgi:hypothetical protein